ncbi:Gfo/Idh/MocA family oxidoreductase [Actinoplanes sp. NEAU-A12]|uniref:Gfo/Idh/MocA family oxidoreductase n=1 Tax=Actinoplanes sandaracinus TaxID=3045177 RepID=A0ABT6WZK2_9ACTN|nr:Gfo/Idh/MocA family oxidoreductase [Actinoplanes sandaracinus]MDI6105183.1 Gfo/Idh/MocA family oxidoreductase [Actinoplanes sandaracinus]
MMSVNRLRMGVMGCADIAWRKTLPAMSAEPSIDVVAIASRTLEKATQFTDKFGGVPVAGYGELLKRDDVDAVYIPLPALLHAEWIERTLLAGKHVLVEKPMTDSYAATSRLVALARQRELVLLENFMFLYHSQHAMVRKLLVDGAIGELRGFSSAFTIPPKPQGDIRYLRDIGGGAFLDFGGYPVRAALHLLGGDLQLVGAFFRHDPELDVVMSGNVLLCTPHGAGVQLTFGMEHSYRNSYSLSGSTGRILLNRVFTPPETHRPVLRIERQDHSEQIVLPADHQFANVIAMFAQAVLDGGDLLAHQEGTLQQATLMERIQRAAVLVSR